MKHHRTNLSKYYKHVKTCCSCGKLYGSDCIKELEDKICPSCSTMGMRAGWKEYITLNPKHAVRKVVKKKLKDNHRLPSNHCRRGGTPIE